MTTALQQYKKAYTLHYVEKNLPEAAAAYKEIIHVYPDSDAAEYSRIQLIKIEKPFEPPEDPFTEHAKKSLSSQTARAPLLLLIINLILTVVFIIIFIIQLNIINNHNKYAITLSRAISAISVGNEDDASVILKELKLFGYNDITPFALSSELYMKNHDFKSARDEYETYKRLYPGSGGFSIAFERINKREESYIRAIKRQQLMQSQNISSIEQKNEAPGKEGSALPRKSTKKQPRQQPKISKDEIKYF